MVTTDDQARTVLPNAPTSPRAGRVFVTRTRHAWGLADGVETVDLLGRGLMLVEGLASDWGVDAHEDRKSVWFEVAA